MFYGWSSEKIESAPFFRTTRIMYPANPRAVRASIAILSGLALWLSQPAISHAAPIVSGSELAAPLGLWATGDPTFTTIGWKVTFPAGVQVDWTPRAGGTGYNPSARDGTANEGTMRIEMNFVDTNPISIEFEGTVQNMQAGPIVPNPRAAGLGLRFTLNEVITNSGQDEWTSFALKLVDPKFQPTVRAADANFGPHPVQPHFHGDLRATGAPLTYRSGGGTTGADAGNSFGFLNFGNPGERVVGTGQGMLNLTGIGIHDWEVTGYQRKFALVAQPNATFTQPPDRVALPVIFSDLSEMENIGVDDGGAGGTVSAMIKTASYSLRVPTAQFPGTIMDASAYVLEPGTANQRVRDRVDLQLVPVTDTLSDLFLNFTSFRGGPLPLLPANVEDFVVASGQEQDVSRVFVTTGGSRVTLPTVTIRVVSTIPEPSTWLLLSTGLTGLLGYGWWRRKKQTA